MGNGRSFSCESVDGRFHWMGFRSVDRRFHWSQIRGRGYQNTKVSTTLPPSLTTNHHFTQLPFHGLRDGAMRYWWNDTYKWCGAATCNSSRYSNLQAMSKGYNIPIFLSETGCNIWLSISRSSHRRRWASWTSVLEVFEGTFAASVPSLSSI
jgi:hypothetical protein